MLFLFYSVPDKYKTQKKCDEVVDNCLPALKFIPDWIVINKMFETFHDSLPINDDIIFFGENYSEVIFFTNQIGILGVDMDEINLADDKNFYESDSDIFIQVRLLALRNIFEKHKTFKKR